MNGELKEKKHTVCWLNLGSNVNRVLSPSLDQGNFLKAGCQFYFIFFNTTLLLCAEYRAHNLGCLREGRGYFPMRHCSFLIYFAGGGEQLGELKTDSLALKL